MASEERVEELVMQLNGIFHEHGIEEVPTVVDVWFAAFNDVSDGTLVKACANHVRFGTRFPKPAEIMNHIREACVAVPKYEVKALPELRRGKDQVKELFAGLMVSCTDSDRFSAWWATVPKDAPTDEKILRMREFGRKELEGKQKISDLGAELKRLVEEEEEVQNLDAGEKALLQFSQKQMEKAHALRERMNQ